MAEPKIVIYEYQRIYKKMTKKMQSENTLLYNLLLLTANYKALEDREYISKINKPTTRGTTVTFKPIKSKDDLEKSREISLKLYDKIKEHSIDEYTELTKMAEEYKDEENKTNANSSDT